MGLFDFFKKDLNVYAPVNGMCYDISKCNDNVFSSKLMGDGFVIEPQDGIICSPADGVITMLFPTLHAFGLKMANEQEILVHIGINTVELNGEYFESLVQLNQRVKHGTPIVKVQLDQVKNRGFDVSIIVAMVNKQDVVKSHLDEEVTVDSVVIGG